MLKNSQKMRKKIAFFRQKKSRLFEIGLEIRSKMTKNDEKKGSKKCQKMVKNGQKSSKMTKMTHV